MKENEIGIVQSNGAREKTVERYVEISEIETTPATAGQRRGEEDEGSCKKPRSTESDEQIPSLADIEKSMTMRQSLENRFM